MRSTENLRVFSAIAIGVSAVAYTAGVVSGLLDKDNRIDAVHLGIIALAIVCIAILLQPAVVSRLRVLEMTGFKLELLESVEKVKEKQAKQGDLLNDINLVLPLLLPETERTHLFNLEAGKTNEYKGGGSLRAELRRLRSIGLIKMRSENRIGDMRDGWTFDLANYIELTEHGERWVRRIRDIERADPPGNQ